MIYSADAYGSDVCPLVASSAADGDAKEYLNNPKHLSSKESLR